MLPEVATGSGLTVLSASTRVALLKGGTSWGAQAVFLGPREVNYAAVVSDMYLPGYISPAVGSAIEIRPFSQQQNWLTFVGGPGQYNKPLYNFGVEAGIGYLGYGIGQIAFPGKVGEGYVKWQINGCWQHEVFNSVYTYGTPSIWYNRVEYPNSDE